MRVCILQAMPTSKPFLIHFDNAVLSSVLRNVHLSSERDPAVTIRVCQTLFAVKL